jgi:acylpyruvate hydrolase
MGPVLVTADEIPNPHNLNIRLRLGDEVMQSSNTSFLIFNVNYLIAYLSAVMTLEPGDSVSVEIEGLGVLENPVVAES